MKPRHYGLLATALLTGCVSTPEQEHPASYRVQVVEIEVPADVAEAHWRSPAWALDPTHVQDTVGGEASIPCLGVKTLADGLLPHDQQTLYTDAQGISASAEQLMQHPEACITTFPEAVMSGGEHFTEDRTEAIELPIDYDVVDGQTVVTALDTFRTGRSIDIQLMRADTSTATCRLKLFTGLLKGFDSYTLSNGDEIQMPFSESRSCNTEITLPFGYWYTLGGLIHEKAEGDTAIQLAQIFCIRITPLNQESQSTAAE